MDPTSIYGTPPPTPAPSPTSWPDRIGEKLFNIPLLGDILDTGRDILVGPGSENLSPQEQVKRGIITALVAGANPSSLPSLWASFGQQDQMGRQILSTVPFQQRAQELGGPNPDSASMAQAARELGYPSGMRLPSALPPIEPSTQLRETAAGTTLGEAKRRAAAGDRAGVYDLFDIPLTPQQGAERAAATQTSFKDIEGGKPSATSTTIKTGQQSTTYKLSSAETMPFEEAVKRGYTDRNGNVNPQYVVAQVADAPEGTVAVSQVPEDELQRRREMDHDLQAKTDIQASAIRAQAKTLDERADKMRDYLFDPELVAKAGFAKKAHEGTWDEVKYRFGQSVRQWAKGTKGNEDMGELLRRGATMVTNLSRDFGGEKGVITDKDIQERALKNVIEAGDTIPIIDRKRADFEALTKELRARKADPGWHVPEGERLVDFNGDPIDTPDTGTAPPTAAPPTAPTTPRPAARPMRGSESAASLDPDVAAILDARRKSKGK